MNLALSSNFIAFNSRVHASSLMMYLIFKKKHNICFYFDAAECVASPKLKSFPLWMLYFGVALVTKAHAGLIRTLSHFRHFACRERRAGSRVLSLSLLSAYTYYYTHCTAAAAAVWSREIRARVYLCVFRCKFKRAARIEFSSYVRDYN